MPTRRRLLGWLVLLIVAFLIGAFWWGSPALSPTERRLLGEWMTPEPDPRASFITAKGPVKSPWRVWEFRRNRSFRVWVVSAVDPTISILDKEGRWSAEGGTLNLEGFGAAGGVVRELRERIRVKFGGSYVARTSGGLSHSIRFLDRDNWELTTPQGKSISWVRRR